MKTAPTTIQEIKDSSASYFDKEPAAISIQMTTTWGTVIAFRDGKIILA